MREGGTKLTETCYDFGESREGRRLFAVRCPAALRGNRFGLALALTKVPPEARAGYNRHAFGAAFEHDDHSWSYVVLWKCIRDVAFTEIGATAEAH